jgi:hypothetical protein
MQLKYYKFRVGAKYAPTVGVFSHMVNRYEWVDGFITEDGARVITNHMTLNGKILMPRRKKNKGGTSTRQRLPRA